jgi:hypothetical protein
MNIVFYPRFERGYKRLGPQIRRIAHQRIALFACAGLLDQK